MLARTQPIVTITTNAILTRVSLRGSSLKICPARVKATYAYSSLRRPRQYGPRGRILNHVEAMRPSQKMPSRIVGAMTQQQHLPYQEPEHQHHGKRDHLSFSPDPAHTPVDIPSQSGQIIKPDYPGAPVLSQPALVVGREIEMMNIFLGYEQANRYKIMDPNGNHIGFIAEEEGFGKSISRQILRTHRRMVATIMNADGKVVFKIIRPFSLVNSRIYIYTADDELVGEVQQRWHLLRRRYDLFVGRDQFAYIDTPFLGWDFNLLDSNGNPLGNVSRNFMGFAREIFTDTGNYVLRMDAVEGNIRGLTLDERAVTLACAVSIDFDYFSRHSQHGGTGFPIPFLGFGGHSAESPEHTDNDSPGGSPPLSSNGSSSPPATNNDFDPWLTDEEAGVANPDDKSVWGGLFGDDNASVGDDFTDLFKS
ncbi:Scramblase-domain-containing protein [Dichotomocladium elegans]|nr:Scramblase-domain-containing protein [Dichotomocladium elegans]